MRSCVGGHRLPHPVVEVDGWVSAVTGQSPERVAQALLAVASDGLHLAGIHSHASRGHTATGVASPVFPGPVGHILDGMGCPLGTMPVGDDCLMRPRADVERNYIRRGGENRRTELPSHLLNRLQYVQCDTRSSCMHGTALGTCHVTWGVCSCVPLHALLRGLWECCTCHRQDV